jgi:hypothetical protein
MSLSMVSDISPFLIPESLGGHDLDNGDCQVCQKSVRVIDK